ncbi:hypothetical protein [uncultured Variovorax sp.]|uniref:hypothetical protein n=1 Tax=uncultured Variovorax sp. TaxID=114708 RepID=UPI0025CE737F|nr:hypothetical protein [uncultured Variovorax sp.]
MATRFDVCNGDADGLCAAVQWRLHRPGAVRLVTGLKRDIALLGSVSAGPGDEVNVFDISMLRNRADVLRLLGEGARVRYFDHHAAGEVPRHPQLEAHIDEASAVCTSLLVDRHLGGACRAWALVGIYGDNMAAVADRLALDGGFEPGDCAGLHRLGMLINYNAYGEHEHDVRIAPRLLYALMLRYRDPRDMLAHESIVDEIDAVRQADLRRALGTVPIWQGADGSVRVLPDAPWSRRVLGCLANELASREPALAHAVLVARDGGYVVSVRAPQARPDGAHALCSRFGGAGRARAAGIDRLPRWELPRFVAAFAAAPWGGRAAAS